MSDHIHRPSCSILLIYVFSNTTEIALKTESLDVFHDKKTTFYQVRCEDTTCLKMHDKVWKVVDSVSNHWRRYNYAKRGPLKSRAWATKFKVLVYADPVQRTKVSAQEST